MAERSSQMTRLYRSRRDRVITGLAGGLSETLGIDSTLFRILVLISIPFTGGAVIPVYLIAALIIPKEHYQPPFGPGPGGPYGESGGYGGYGQPGGNGGHGGFGGYGQPGGNGGYGSHGHSSSYNPNFNKNQSAPDSSLDDMMKDIEKKALQKEVAELKQKLAKYEKGEV